MDNLSYLFWAYAIFWVALLVYIYNLHRKSKELKREIEAFKDSLLIMKDSSGKVSGVKR